MGKAETVPGLRQSGAYISQLESLRGWAILLVVAFHYFGALYRQTPPPKNGFFLHTSSSDPFWVHISAAGNTGVVLFFVLSGFLLSRPFLQAHITGAVVEIRKFYISRALRIIPLYYVAVIFAFFFTGNFGATIKSLLFIPVGSDMFPYSVPWWTLCTEMQFYLLLPWLMALLSNKFGRIMLTVLLLGWLAVHICLYLTPGWLNNMNNWHLQGSLFGRGLAFIIGVLCAALYSSNFYWRLFRRGWTVWSLLALLLAGLYYLLRWYALMGQLPAIQAMPLIHDLEAILWGGVLLCCISLHGARWIKLLLFNPVLNHLGSLSYSIYLVHVPIQVCFIVWFRNDFERWLGEMATAGLILASFSLIWLISLLTYKYLELPCLRLKSHIPTFAVGQNKKAQA